MVLVYAATYPASVVVNAVAIPANTIGANTQEVISAAVALQLGLAGFGFVIRRLTSTSPQLASDLSAEEIQTLYVANLGIMVLQNALGVGWVPTAALGYQQGSAAVANATSLNLPLGMSLWNNYTGVNFNTSADGQVAYLVAWASMVITGGYLPGVYGANIPKTFAPQRWWTPTINTPPTAPRRGACLTTVNPNTNLFGISFDTVLARPDAALGSAVMDLALQ